jgi:guanine deaminase
MTDVHMRRAIELSSQSVQQGGGPFGAVVVLDGRVLGEGKNRVVPDGDPTAHAEINAIRNACRAQASHSLQGAVIYTSCEPCPMCLAAIWWARISRIVFANSRDAAADIGFDDAALYSEVSAPLEHDIGSPRFLTLPLRGRVDAKRRGGVKPRNDASQLHRTPAHISLGSM